MMTFWVRWINLDTSRWHSLSSEMKHVFYLRPNTYKHFLKWHVLLINTTHENNAIKENMSQHTFLLFSLEKIIKNSPGFVLHLNLTWPMALCFHLFICFMVFGTHDEALPRFWYNCYLFSLDIRKLKAALATPLDFGDGDNEMDVDTGSEMSAAQAQKKVNATSVKNVLWRKWFRNGKFNLGDKIRKMHNGYYLVSVGQEIWYHRMLRDLNQGTVFFKF